MKIKKLSLMFFGLLFLIMPFIIAQECEEGFICGESSISVSVNDSTSKVPNPGSNLITPTVILVLCIIIIYVAFKYSKKAKRAKELNKKTLKKETKTPNNSKKSSKKK